MTVTTRAQLDALPTGTVIRCEIAEYHGVFTLNNSQSCCSGWHDEAGDDYTPELPAEVVA